MPLRWLTARNHPPQLYNSWYIGSTLAVVAQVAYHVTRVASHRFYRALHVTIPSMHSDSPLLVGVIMFVKQSVDFFAVWSSSPKRVFIGRCVYVHLLFTE